MLQPEKVWVLQQRPSADQKRKKKKKGEEKGLPRDCDRIMFVKMGKTKDKILSKVSSVG